MNGIRVVNTGKRHFSLGAEELIELGQASSSAVAIPSLKSREARTVSISAPEGKLIVQVVENIVSFSKSFPVEFMSYCPADRWEAALSQVGTWMKEIQLQVDAGQPQIQVPADMIFHLVDLEKCVSAARDARLSSSRWAFLISAGAGIAGTLFGIGWLSIPAYITGLALLYGRPLYARYQATPQEPYAPVLSGRNRHYYGLSGQCQLIAAKLAEEEKSDPNRRKVLERVIVAGNGPEFHHWGYVVPHPESGEGSSCLKKGRFRVRVEGWRADEVVPQNGWELCESSDCNGQIILAVWTPSYRSSAETSFGEVSQDSGHENTYWVEYTGPLTEGSLRRAGPFGCTVDPVAHAMEDAGFAKDGVDGAYEIFDSAGDPVPKEGEEVLA